jgi:predicted alpha/beta superfamily hydrolase
MKKTIFAVVALAFSVIMFAQADNKITIGTIDSVPSKILNENRKIWVYLPNGGNANAIFSQQKYPVVYLLDGNAHFASVVGMIQQLSQVNGNTVCPEMIVVGIPNTIRERDLTPTKTGDDPFLKQSSPVRVSLAGGGEAFMSFIEKELMPYIDSKYPTQPYKTLIGHSLGGLTVMNALINHTKLFNSYIAIDPSMWWDNGNFAKTTIQALAEKDFTGTTLYVGIANSIDPGMNIKQIRKDTTLATRHMRLLFEMDDFIKKEKPKGLRYASKYYENDNHNSSPLITEYDALRFIFEKYQLKIENRDILDSNSAFAAKIQLRYKDISKLFGYEVKPPENEINTWGYRFLQRKQFKKAEEFFKMNVANYPESFNVYDSYGDYFMAIGSKARAIEQFKKALSIKEYKDTRDKLNKLLE